MTHDTSPTAVLEALRGRSDQLPSQLAELLWAQAEALTLRDEWDQPNTLHAVVRDEQDWAGCWLRAVGELPGRPSVSLAYLAEGISRGAVQIPEAGKLVAWLLISEGWMLGNGTEQELAQWAGRIERHPARVEVRTLAMADRAGVRYQIITPRDGLPMMLVSDPTCTDPVSDIALSGELPDALVKLMEATPL